MALDVVCDCSATRVFVTALLAIAQPMRHPVMANAFAIPSMTMMRSLLLATDNKPAAGPSYAMRW